MTRARSTIARQVRKRIPAARPGPCRRRAAPLGGGRERDRTVVSGGVQRWGAQRWGVGEATVETVQCCSTYPVMTVAQVSLTDTRALSIYHSEGVVGYHLLTAEPYAPRRCSPLVSRVHPTHLLP